MYLSTDLCFENWFVFWKLIWAKVCIILVCVGPLSLLSADSYEPGAGLLVVIHENDASHCH